MAKQTKQTTAEGFLLVVTKEEVREMCSWWPARLPALCLPSFKAEERARVSNRDMDD